MFTTNSLRLHRVWRHVKTDSLYVVLGTAVCSTNGPRENTEASVVYYSIEYQGLRYRELSEFLDGRFEPVQAKVR